MLEQSLNFNASLGKPQDAKLPWKDVIHTMFSARTFTLTIELNMKVKDAAYLTEWRLYLKSCINEVFSSQLGISGLPETWNFTQNELFFSDRTHLLFIKLTISLALDRNIIVWYCNRAYWDSLIKCANIFRVIESHVCLVNVNSSWHSQPIAI